MIVIGLIGQPSAGKDVAAHYLVSRGFRHISTGNLLRDEMTKRNIPIDRPHMHDFAIAMRKEHGTSYPASEAAKQAADMIAGDPTLAGVVVSGLRNVSEVAILKDTFDKRFTLVAVEAPIEMRYERARARNRVGDNLSFDQFKQQEDIERKNSEGGAYSVDAIIAMADKTIANAASEPEFFAAIDRVLTEILPRVK